MLQSGSASRVFRDWARLLGHFSRFSRVECTCELRHAEAALPCENGDQQVIELFSHFDGYFATVRSTSAMNSLWYFYISIFMSLDKTSLVSESESV